MALGFRGVSTKKGSLRKFAVAMTGAWALGCGDVPPPPGGAPTQASPNPEGTPPAPPRLPRVQPIPEEVPPRVGSPSTPQVYGCSSTLNVQTQQGIRAAGRVVPGVKLASSLFFDDRPARGRDVLLAQTREHEWPVQPGSKLADGDLRLYQIPEAEVFASPFPLRNVPSAFPESLRVDAVPGEVRQVNVVLANASQSRSYTPIQVTAAFAPREGAARPGDDCLTVKKVLRKNLSYQKSAWGSFPRFVVWDDTESVLEPGQFREFRLYVQVPVELPGGHDYSGSVRIAFQEGATRNFVEVPLLVHVHAAKLLAPEPVDLQRAALPRHAITTYNPPNLMTWNKATLRWEASSLLRHLAGDAVTSEGEAYQSLMLTQLRALRGIGYRGVRWANAYANVSGAGLDVPIVLTERGRTLQLGKDSGDLCRAQRADAIDLDAARGAVRASLEAGMDGLVILPAKVVLPLLCIEAGVEVHNQTMLRLASASGSFDPKEVDPATLLGTHGFASVAMRELWLESLFQFFSGGYHDICRQAGAPNGCPFKLAIELQDEFSSSRGSRERVRQWAHLFHLFNSGSGYRGAHYRGEPIRVANTVQLYDTVHRASDGVTMRDGLLSPSAAGDRVLDALDIVFFSGGIERFARWQVFPNLGTGGAAQYYRYHKTINVPWRVEERGNSGKTYPEEIQSFIESAGASQGTRALGRYPQMNRRWELYPESKRAYAGLGAAFGSATLNYDYWGHLPRFTVNERGEHAVTPEDTPDKVADVGVEGATLFFGYGDHPERLVFDSDLDWVRQGHFDFERLRAVQARCQGSLSCTKFLTLLAALVQSRPLNVSEPLLSTILPDSDDDGAPGLGVENSCVGSGDRALTNSIRWMMTRAGQTSTWKPIGVLGDAVNQLPLAVYAGATGEGCGDYPNFGGYCEGASDTAKFDEHRLFTRWLFTGGKWDCLRATMNRWLEGE